MRLFKVVTFFLGAGLLIWIVRKIGLNELFSSFQTLGWRLIVPIILIFPCYLFYTWSWQLFLKRFEHHSIPFGALLKIKIAGEASNTLTPLNFIGGDPIRIWMLSKNFPKAISGASVVVDRTIQSMAIISMIFLGNLAALFKMDLSSGAKKILATTASFLILFIAFLIFHQTRGLSEKIFRLGQRLGLKTFSEEHLHKIQELDRHVIEFYRRDRRLFFFCYLIHLAGRFVGMTELIVLGYFLDVPIGLWGALFFSAVIPVTNLIGAIVPGTFGVLEGVVSSLFLALHWNPADAIVLQIARRVRALFWILLGSLFILLSKEKNPRP